MNGIFKLCLCALQLGPCETSQKPSRACKSFWLGRGTGHRENEVSPKTIIASRHNRDWRTWQGHHVGNAASRHIVRFFYRIQSLKERSLHLLDFACFNNQSPIISSIESTCSLKTQMCLRTG